MINSVIFLYFLHDFSHLYFFGFFNGQWSMVNGYYFYIYIGGPPLTLKAPIFGVGYGGDAEPVGWGREGVPPSRALPDMGSLGSLGRFLFRIQGYLSQHLNQGYLGLFILKNGKNNQFLIKIFLEIFKKNLFRKIFLEINKIFKNLKKK